MLSNIDLNVVRVSGESACRYSTGPTNLLRMGSLWYHVMFFPLSTLLTHLYAKLVTLFLRANLSEKCQ